MELAKCFVAFDVTCTVWKTKQDGSLTLTVKAAIIKCVSVYKGSHGYLYVTAVAYCDEPVNHYH